jgi:uncharacterized protein involved in exopolysaccharide biosynthesis
VFLINLTTKSNEQVDSLQRGILYYLQNNPYVKQRTAIRKQNLEALRIQIQEEIKKLDSLRFSFKRAGNSSVTVNEFGLNQRAIMIDLYERELKIKESLSLIDDIQVVQDFTPFSKPAGPKLLQSIGVSTGGAIVLAIIIIVLIEASRGIHHLKNEQEKKPNKKEELV